MARIEADVTIEDGTAGVVLTGALDLYTAHKVGALLRRLITEGYRDVVVDLAAVERVDPAGVGVLQGAASVLAGKNGRLRCRNGRDGLAIDLREPAPADSADSESPAKPDLAAINRVRHPRSGGKGGRPATPLASKPTRTTAR
ncbi:MAG TPA: STAS domain-containing protein [Acidimicrobiales bacterium]